jgi:hypothetical protein
MADTPPPSDNLGPILGGSGAAILSLLGIIYTKINHKHVKAKCCGKVFEAELDIGSTATAATTATATTATAATAKVHPSPSHEEDIEKGKDSA